MLSVICEVSVILQSIIISKKLLRSYAFHIPIKEEIIDDSIKNSQLRNDEQARG